MCGIILPKWAPRVKAEKIRELYNDDAQGIMDEALLEEVGYSMLARAYSFRQTLKAHHEGIIMCPVCDKQAAKVEDKLICACGWIVTSKAYHLTYKGKQLTGVSVVPMVDHFIHEFENAHEYGSKMRAIDNLLHRFHWEIQNSPTRPLAVNFIDLRLNEVVKFIIDLGYKQDDEAAREQWEMWLRNAKQSNYYNKELEGV